MEGESIGLPDLNPSLPCTGISPTSSKSHEISSEIITSDETILKSPTKTLIQDHFPPLPNLNVKNPAVNPFPIGSDQNIWKNPPDLSSNRHGKVHLRFIPPAVRGDNLVGVCSSEAVAGELQILDNTLVGFFLGRKPSFTYTRSNLLKQWKMRGSVETLQLINGGMAFRFSDMEDRERVLEVGAFYVGGQPIFLRKWERSLHTGGILGLKHIPLWISLPGLPLHLWGEDSLSAACSVLGKPLFTDRFTAEKSRWAYARVCVEFSGAAPLLETITIEDDVGTSYEQPVKYDWRPPHCLACGIFGHVQDACKKGPSVEDAGKDTSNMNLQEESNLQMEPKEKGEENDKSKGEEEKSVTTAADFRKDSNGEAFLMKNARFSGQQGKQLLQGFVPVRIRNRMPSRVRKTNPKNLMDQPDPFSDQQAYSDLTCLPLGGVLTNATSSTAVSAYSPDQSKPTSPFLLSFSKSPATLPSVPPCSNRFQILDCIEKPQPPDVPSVTATPAPLKSYQLSKQCENQTSSAGHTPHPRHLVPAGRTVDPLNLIQSPALMNQPTLPNPTSLEQNLDGPGPDLNGPTLPAPSNFWPKPNPLPGGSVPHRSTPKLLQPSPPGKIFFSITSADLEAMMAPVPVSMANATSDEEEVNDKNDSENEEEVDQESAGKRKDQDQREEDDMEQAKGPKAVETWVDLEESLKNPRNFFQGANQTSYNLF